MLEEHLSWTCGVKKSIKHSKFAFPQSLPRHSLINSAQPLDHDMVAWICSRFIEEADRFAVQSHMFTPETEIADSSDVFFTVTVIVFEEEID